jgi:DNA-binding beta-propeller fold protein YncE
MRRSWIFLSLLVLVQSVSTAQVQEYYNRNIFTGDDNGSIRWVNQFPPTRISDRSSFGEKVVNALFGKKDIELISKPVHVIADDTNNFWILDQGTGLIMNVRDQVGDIPHKRSKNFKYFPSLVAMCFLPGEKILFSDSFLNKLFVVSPDQKELEIFNDSLVFDRPTGIAYSSVNQQIWVVETNAHCISVLDENGQLLKEIGTRGDGPGEFNFPTYIWIDKFGKVFIVDAMNFRVQVFSENGEIISIFGKVGDGSGSFARPRGIATDSEGNIYIADALFNTIQIFDLEGNFLYNFGMQGQEEGKFWMPAGIYIDSNDFIYVADTYNSRIQVFEYVKAKR